jgi:CheY-like chemotaxis protein
VTMWLPRAEEASVAKAESALDESPAKEIPPLRILLVDDHPEVRATTAALLEDNGHAIVEAADGRKALRLLAAKRSFDLLITDYAMPNVSGAEVIAGSRKLRPELAAIMITGYADPATLPAPTRRVTLLAKPFTPAQMNEAICKALKSREEYSSAMQ